MNYAHFLKKLAYPDGFQPPSRLTHRDVVATAITRADLTDDVHGINASLDLIPKTRGGKWPTGPVTEEENSRHLPHLNWNVQGVKGELRGDEVLSAYAG